VTNDKKLILALKWLTKAVVFVTTKHFEPSHTFDSESGAVFTTLNFLCKLRNDPIS
jgi:hypothetical protein